jgi:hypothetical protein
VLPLLGTNAWLAAPELERIKHQYPHTPQGEQAGITLFEIRRPIGINAPAK